MIANTWMLLTKLPMTTYGDAYDRFIEINFYVSEFEEHWYGDKVVFEQK